MVSKRITEDMNSAQNSHNPLFSVIVPVHNAERYMGECIGSIVTQSVDDIELILVDDGSTDGSANLCNRYVANDQRIHVIHKRNGGPSSARNAGLHASTGKWVVFIDADDLLEPGALAFVQPHIEDDVDIVCFNYSRVSEDNSDILFVGRFPETRKSNASEFLDYVDCGLLENYVPTKVYRRSFLMRTSNPFDEGVHFLEDVEFTHRVCSAARAVAYCNRVLYRYRERMGSLCHTESPSRAMEGLDVMRAQLAASEFRFRTDDCLNRVIGTLFMCYDIAGGGISAASARAKSEIMAEILSVAKRTDNLSMMNRLKIALVKVRLYVFARNVIDQLRKWRSER